MKTRYLIPVLLILTLPISVMGQERMDLSNLVQKGDQYLIPGILSPYTGPIVSYHFPYRNVIWEWGQLRNGVWDGLYENYFDNGQLWRKGKYENGEQCGKWLLKDGETVTHPPCSENGEFDGPFEDYYENGQLREKTTYKDGILDGPYELYYENGQLRWKGTYKDRERCGEWFQRGQTVTYDPC